MHVKVNSRVDKIFIDEFAGMVSRAAGKYKGREECNSMTFAAVPLYVAKYGQRERYYRK